MKTTKKIAIKWENVISSVYIIITLFKYFITTNTNIGILIYDLTIDLTIAYFIYDITYTLRKANK